MSSQGKGPIPTKVLVTLDERDLGYDRLHGHYIGKGRNAHHRKLRSRGGENLPSNIVTMSGSGTTGTHGWVHANIAEAEHIGFIVPSWIDDPADVPIRLADAHGRKTWARLLDSGRVVDLTDREAEQRMRKLGIWDEAPLF